MKKPYVAIVGRCRLRRSIFRTFLSLRGYEARCYTRGDELLAVDEADRGARRGAARRDDAGPRRHGDAARAEGVPAGGAGHHALGTQPGLDDRRSRPARRRRLRREAGRPRRAGRNRARRRDQERDREEPARLRAERAPAAAVRRRRPRGLGQQREDAGDRDRHRAGRRQRCRRADSRRERRRQGAGRRARSTSAPPGATAPLSK